MTAYWRKHNSDVQAKARAECMAGELTEGRTAVSWSLPLAYRFWQSAEQWLLSYVVGCAEENPSI